MTKASRPLEHIWVPDPQVKPGVPTNHLEACANYIVHKKPDVIIVAGDWWDMPSLSSYEEKGSKYFHDKSYGADIQAGNDAMRLFRAPIDKEIARISNNKKRKYDPRFVFLKGNHEDRVRRALHDSPMLAGAISEDHFDLAGWEVHPYLQPVDIDGILYCHLFQNPQSLTRGGLSGSMTNRLNKIKQSFTQGHQQILDWGQQYTASGRRIIGLVAGAFYQHEEGYMGPQGTNYWRGVVYKHEVNQGEYDVMPVSLNYLLRKWL
jgi:hypothetical protein